MHQKSLCPQAESEQSEKREKIRFLYDRILFEEKGIYDEKFEGHNWKDD